MEWTEFALAMTMFLASHRLPAVPGLKAALVSRLGKTGYVVLFSTVSLGLLWWLIVAAARAPQVALWDQTDAARWLVNLVMPLVCLLAAYGVAAPNPFAFEGRMSGFDPARPGIAGLTRQPLLWALALWAGTHLLANGDLAHVLLFAPFLILALAGFGVVEARRRRAMGDAEWHRLTASTSLVPLAALVTGRFRPRALPSALRFAAGLAAWAALWHLHPWVIGVWPGP